MPEKTPPSPQNKQRAGDQSDQRSSDAEQPGVKHFVTPLMPIEQQVGLHVINALQQPDTVAVLTTVMSGAGGQQHIVSIGLDQESLDQVQALQAEHQEAESSRVPCIGFHCFLPGAAPPEEDDDKN